MNALAYLKDKKTELEYKLDSSSLECFVVSVYENMREKSLWTIFITFVILS